jgi:hypothetical protein
LHSMFHIQMEANWTNETFSSSYWNKFSDV